MCSLSCINIDCIILDQFGIEHTRNDFSEESNRFLMEFLRIADVAEGNFIKGILWILKWLLLLPFFISSCMILARVGTTPRTAYSDYLTHGFISVQKYPVFLVENLLSNLWSMQLLAIKFNLSKLQSEIWKKSKWKTKICKLYLKLCNNNRTFLFWRCYDYIISKLLPKIIFEIPIVKL